MAIQDRIMVVLDESSVAGAEFRRGAEDRRPAGTGAGAAGGGHGSLRAAGRALGLSQPTIGRRLAAFETTFGGPTLFDRLPEGLRLNAAGNALLPAAEQPEGAALTLERRHAAASTGLIGNVRVSTGEC